MSDWAVRKLEAVLLPLKFDWPVKHMANNSQEHKVLKIKVGSHYLRSHALVDVKVRFILTPC